MAAAQLSRDVGAAGRRGRQISRDFPPRPRPALSLTPPPAPQKSRRPFCVWAVRRRRMRGGGPARPPLGGARERRGRPPFCPGPAVPARDAFSAAALHPRFGAKKSTKTNVGGRTRTAVTMETPRRRAGALRMRRGAAAPIPGTAFPRHISPGRHFVRSAAALRRRGAWPRPSPRRRRRRPGHVARGAGAREGHSALPIGRRARGGPPPEVDWARRSGGRR